MNTIQKNLKYRMLNIPAKILDPKLSIGFYPAFPGCRAVGICYLVFCDL